jgi:hypothetical protein
MCRFSTGGSPENLEPICGSSVGNNYNTAISTPANWCKPDTEVNWSGNRTWVGLVGARTTFFSDTNFTKFKNKPMNRLCVEVEIPVSRVRYVSLSGRDEGVDLNAQLVNPQRAHPNLKWVRFEMGSYTSVYASENLGVRDTPEEGQTYHGGGMHFYNKPAMYGTRPLDKAYAISDSVVVMCFSPAPSGVRSGMGPAYSSNPLANTVGNDSNGYTNTPEFFNYLTRAYIDMNGYAKVKYPFTIKYNKFFGLYEKNEIFAMDSNGSMMGVALAKDSVPTYYPFTVYNWANQARVYVPTIRSGENLPNTRTSATFKIFIDQNKNSILDTNEKTEILPNINVTLPANTDLSLIAVHTPKWSDTYNANTKYNRKLWEGFLTLQELGRLRMTQFGVRTWLATTAELAKKDSILKAIEYPPSSDMLSNAQWNQNKPNNGRLIKNSPDYLMALQKAGLVPTQTIVNDTIIVYDTTIVNVPITIYDTTITNIPVIKYDTTITNIGISLFDTTITHIAVPITIFDTTITQVMINRFDTTITIVPVTKFDTTITIVNVNKYDTNTVIVPVTKYDTTVSVVPVHVTTVKFDTSITTVNVNIPKYDTIVNNFNINVPKVIFDTTITNIPISLYDTTYTHIPVPKTVYDTTITRVPVTIMDSVVTKFNVKQIVTPCLVE